jgi:hypothetical protein
MPSGVLAASLAARLPDGFQEHRWFTRHHLRHLAFSSRGLARQARSSRLYPALGPLVVAVLSAGTAGACMCSHLRCLLISCPGCVPAQTPPLNPIAARPHVRRVLSRVGGADHVVTPKAPWTGSGWRGYSYGGFGGGHPQFLPHAPRPSNPKNGD